MRNRLELQTILEDLLGSRNVYYQPPENLKMSYPAIRYYKEDINSIFANNSKYINTNKYQIIVIDKLPDNNVIEDILKLPLTSFDRQYISDSLYHDVITIYF